MGRARLIAGVCGVVLVAMVVAFTAGTFVGADRVRDKAARRALDAAQTAKEIEDDVGKMPDSAIRDELRRWMRPAD